MDQLDNLADQVLMASREIKEALVTLVLQGQPVSLAAPVNWVLKVTWEILGHVDCQAQQVSLG